MSIDIHNDDLETALCKLKAREEILKEFSMLAGLGNWEVDLQTKQSQWSENLYKIYGVAKEEHVHFETFLSLLLPPYREKATQLVQHALKSKEIFSFQAQAQRQNDGKIIDVLIHGKTLYDSQDNPVKLIGSTQDITDILTLQQEAKELSELVENSTNEIYIVDMQTLNFLYVNQGAIKALGFSKEQLLNMNIRDINPYLQEEEIEKITATLKKQGSTLNKTIHQRRDGSVYYVQSYLHLSSYKNKDAYVIFDTDISDIVELESKYKRQARVLENIHDAVITTDIYGNITTWNNGSQKLFGYTLQEVLGKSIGLIFSPNNDMSLNECFDNINKGVNLNAEINLITKDGTELICDVSLSASRDDFGIINGYVGYIQDITQNKQTQKLLDIQTQKLRYQAHHDALTDLPNRALFQERLEQSVADAKRDGQKFALLFLDLDQFKNINDTLGHHVGDEVLVEVAKRIQTLIRKEDTLSRLGGDEFTLIVKNINDENDAARVAQKIINILQDPIVLNNVKLYVSSSIGIAIYPDHSAVPNNLVKYADVAMYKAKDAGRNNYQFYSSEMTDSAFERVILEQSLRIAIKEKDFVVYYHPQIDAKSHTIVGMEALVRWKHSNEDRIIPPDKFIPLAEDTGLIYDIDMIVMNQAMRQFQQWYKEGENPGRLSVNISVKTLDRIEFLHDLSKALEETGYDPSKLILEITEGHIMQNPKKSIKKLTAINELGVSIAMDDFGTGYSSLAYLKRLPIKELKIDRAFIEGLPHDDEDIAISRIIISLAQVLNLELVAEGVETQEQNDFMLQNGCNVIQGYFYIKPSDATEMQRQFKVFQT